MKTISWRLSSNSPSNKDFTLFLCSSSSGQASSGRAANQDPPLSMSAMRPTWSHSPQTSNLVASQTKPFERSKLPNLATSRLFLLVWLVAMEASNLSISFRSSSGNRFTVSWKTQCLMAHSAKRPGWNGRRRRYTKLPIPNSTVSGTCSFSSSIESSHPAACTACSMSNFLVFSNVDTETTPRKALSTVHLRLRSFTACSISSSWEGVTRSTLLRTTTSANSICLIIKSTIFLSSASLTFFSRSPIEPADW
mmetsp:Transcript_57443/g.122199  ORF Transcript_57443/g.122199 Transcript_57443/m.122199 type:complete len:251 (-) Transcript_57443:705-1457(-)